MKVFITKYALTKGIEAIEVDEDTLDRSKGGLLMVKINGYNQYFHGEGRDWHETSIEARKRAEHMRVKKIESLKKSIAKLEKMRF